MGRKTATECATPAKKWTVRQYARHLLNHINSTRRSKLGGKTPFELADGEEFLKLKDVMGLKAIPADEVDLTPRLLRKK